MLSIRTLHLVYASWCFLMTLSLFLTAVSIASAVPHARAGERPLLVGVTGAIWLLALAAALGGYVQLSFYLEGDA